MIAEIPTVAAFGCSTIAAVSIDFVEEAAFRRLRKKLHTAMLCTPAVAVRPHSSALSGTARSARRSKQNGAVVTLSHGRPSIEELLRRPCDDKHDCPRRGFGPLHRLGCALCAFCEETVSEHRGRVWKIKGGQDLKGIRQPLLGHRPVRSVRRSRQIR